MWKLQERHSINRYTPHIQNKYTSDRKNNIRRFDRPEKLLNAKGLNDIDPGFVDAWCI